MGYRASESMALATPGSEHAFLICALVALPPRQHSLFRLHLDPGARCFSRVLRLATARAHHTTHSTWSLERRLCIATRPSRAVLMNNHDSRMSQRSFRLFWRTNTTSRTTTRFRQEVTCARGQQNRLCADERDRWPAPYRTAWTSPKRVISTSHWTCRSATGDRSSVIRGTSYLWSSGLTRETWLISHA